MAIFVETMVARNDGKLVTSRVEVTKQVAHSMAQTWARGFQEEVSSECWCDTCAPLLENDFGEEVSVRVMEYSSEARVKTGIEIY